MMTKAVQCVYLHVSAYVCVCVWMCVCMSPAVMQEPGAYTGKDRHIISYPRPLHCSSRGQPNITNAPGESVVIPIPRCGRLTPMPPPLPAGWFIVSMPSEMHA